MKRLAWVFACAALAFVGPRAAESSAAPPWREVAEPAAQCRTGDVPISKRIRFARGRTTSVVKDTIRLCTSHEYSLRASAGQTLSVNLATGRRTSLTVYTPSGERLLDGGNDWSGELPETGDYLLSVGTDATARYTLEVTIR